MNDGLLMFSSGIIQPIILVIFMAHELRNWHIPKQNLRQRHRFFLSHSVKKNNNMGKEKQSLKFWITVEPHKNR